MSQAQDTVNLLGQMGSLDDDARAAFLRSQGAVNADPPLPHSSHLKNKTTGLILPWTEILAEQRDIMECCDANGNTDPEVWMRTLDDSAFNPNANDQRILEAQTRIYAQAAQMTGGYMQPMPVMEPQENKYQNEAVPLTEAAQLISDSGAKELLQTLKELEF